LNAEAKFVSAGAAGASSTTTGTLAGILNPDVVSTAG
jgi:hypothetical protein